MKRHLLLLLGLTASLQGCFGGESSPPPPPPGPVESFLINAAPGASTTLDDPQFGKQVHVLLEDNFVSASGEDCKRATVRSPRQEAEVVVICRDRQGVWRLAPRVWGQGLTPAAQEGVSDSSAAPAVAPERKQPAAAPDQTPPQAATDNKGATAPTPPPGQDGAEDAAQTL